MSNHSASQMNSAILATLATIDVDVLDADGIDMAADIAVTVGLDADDFTGFGILTDMELAAIDADIDAGMYAYETSLVGSDPYDGWTAADYDMFTADDTLTDY